MPLRPLHPLRLRQPSPGDRIADPGLTQAANQTLKGRAATTDIAPILVYTCDSHKTRSSIPCNDSFQSMHDAAARHDACPNRARLSPDDNETGTRLAESGPGCQ
jgi:hypothetical protein